MRHIAYASLSGFYVSAIRAEGPDAPPAAIHRDKRVLDRNALAASRGVRVGMPLSEARAILGGDGAFMHWTEEPFREAQSRWLDALAEFSDSVEPEHQHTAYLDLSDHPRPAEVMERLGAELGSRTGLKARVGLSGCRWVARQAALLGDENLSALLTPRWFVAGLPVTAMPIAEEHARTLVLLGYGTVGEVARVGLDTLRSQFGAIAHDVRRASLGGGEAHVDAAYPPGSLSATFVFDGPPETEEALGNGLDDLARRLGRSLSDADATGERVEVAIAHEDGSATKMARSFAKPIARERDVRVALSIMLASLPEKPVESLRVRLPDVRKTRRVQLDIEGGRSRHDAETSVATAISHVRTAFGDGAVRLAGQVRPSRRKIVRRAYSAVNGWVWG